MNRKLRVIATACFVFISAMGFSQTNHVVISEIFGGGGNAGATYKSDFIELYNPTNSPISLVGWSVQYAEAGALSWSATSLSGTIPARGYYLIQEITYSGGDGVSLPTPDAIGTIDLSYTAGKVALVNGTLISNGVSCPNGLLTLVDLVGYGTASCYESYWQGQGGTAPEGATFISIERKARASSTWQTMAIGGADEFAGNGIDTNNNANDFLQRNPQQAQNSSSALESDDITAPTFTSTYPKTGSVLSSGFAVLTGLNETGKTYFVVLPNNATAPSSIQVKNGQNASSGSLSSNLKGTIVVSTASVEYSGSVSGLSPGTDYDVYTVADDFIGNLQSTPTKVDVTTPVTHVVISEIYGGGGNSGSIYKNDFIELYNPTNSAINLTGWSVQYAATTGTNWSSTTLSGTIAAKGYYLVQEGAGGGGTVNLPTPNATGTINMSATAGKVALLNVSGTITAGTSCPTGSTVVDLVGFGSTTNCFEGSFAPAPSATNSIERKANASSTSATMGVGGIDEFLGNGIDTGSNGSDFVIRLPQPQNAAGSVEPETTPPTFTASYPMAVNILSNGFDVITNLNESGKTYFVVLPNDDAAPSSTQVKNGQNASSSGSLASGIIVVSAASTEYSVSVTGLLLGTDYDLYVVADDILGNLQSAPIKVDVTTSSVVIPVLTPSVSSFAFPGFTSKNMVSAQQSFTLSATDLTDNVSISVTGNFLLSFDDLNYSNATTIDISYFSSEQTVYIKFNPDGNSGNQTGTLTISSAGATDKTISLSAIAVDPFTQNFNDPNFLLNSGWTQYSSVGAQVWASTNFGHTCLTGCNSGTVDKAVQINGFSGSAQNNQDWLISPKLDLTAFVNYPVLSFWTISAFAGDGLQLKYSYDYTGSGDPAGVTWYDLDGKFPASNSALWTKSANIVLPKDNPIYVAVVYNSSTAGASRWTFDDWQLDDLASFIDVPAISYFFGEVSAGSSSASNSFTFSAVGYGNITITPTEGYEVSFDDYNFSASQVVSEAEALTGKTVYVRFAPAVKQLKWDGVINFSGTGLDVSYGTLKGSSYLKAETFDIATYNLEFFGTDVKDTGGTEFGPIDDALQVSNVSTVLQTINADIYGVEEIAYDPAFYNLAASQGYSSVLSPRWSYSFNPPDPNFPPQKVGFIYNPSTVTLIDTRVMFADLYDAIRAGNTGLLPGYPTSGGNTPANFWSSGRLPFMATFDVTINGYKKRIKVIDIHAKSGSAQADYDRRKYDVKVLHDSLIAHYPNDNIILVGDYNDDVDTSINTGSESTFKSFVQDAANFTTLTYSLSQSGGVSFPNSNSFLDHIITSNELTNPYIPNSITVEDPRTYINSYISTTSDHLPVSARFLLDVMTDQTITFGPISTKTYLTDGDFPLHASSTSGLEVTYTSSNTEVATVSGNAISLLKPGTTIITASQPGDGSYNSAVDVQQLLTFNKADQSLYYFSGIYPKTFGDDSYSLSGYAYFSSGLPVTFTSSDPAVATISGDIVTITGVGTTTITPIQVGDDYYNAAAATAYSQDLTVYIADQTISFNALPSSYLGDSPFLLTATSSSNLPIMYLSSDETVATVSGSTITLVGVGTTTITASQAGNANYNAATDVQQTLTVLSNVPTTPSTNLIFSNVYSTQMQVSFSPGNGANRLVVIKAGSAVNFVPAANSTYAIGDVGGGNKVVSTDNSTSISLTGLLPLTTYFVTVYEYNGATGQQQYLTTGAPVASRATLALPNVYVVTPADAAINQNVSLTVTSQALAGTTTYFIELNDAPDFTGNSFVKSGVRNQSFSGLIYGKTYYARVRTNLSADYGKVTSFSTLAPNVFATAPANGAINQNSTLNVTSLALAGAAVYTIELNEAADFSGTSLVQSGTRTQNFAGLKYDQQYFARVKTDNYPVFGPSTSFRTAIPNVYATSPANGAINQNVSLNVTSNAFAGATTYTIELNTASDFSGTGFVQTGARTQNFSGLAFAKTYYVRVKTDVSPVYGKVTSFTTASASWFAYVTSPANNAINVNNTTLNITSNVVPNAASYTIQLSETSDFGTVAFEVTGNSRTLAFSGLKYNTTYYSKVTTDVSTEYGQTKSFTTRTAESLAYVVTPADNAVNVNYNVNVRSNTVPGAGNYTIELNTDPGFDPLTKIEQTASTSTIAFSGLAYNTQYFSRVKTDLSVNYGASRDFTTTDPSTFSYITSPANNATNVSWVVNLTANAVPGASTTGYTIEVCTASDFTSAPTITKMGSRVQSFTLLPDQLYYARVRTDIGGYGVVRSFTTGDVVSLAYIISPLDGATGVPGTVNVTSNVVPGASSYTIELNTASDFTTGISTVQTGSRTRPFTGLTPNTTYYARVQTNVAVGQWGQVKSFTISSTGARSQSDWMGTDGAEEVVAGEQLVKVFPNPFEDKFTVLVEDAGQVEVQMQLLDLNGRAIRSWTDQTNRMIEVQEELSQGMYLLKVIRRNEVEMVKVMRQ